MKKIEVIVSVPGKIILTGEHAVVYGCPALATAVDSRMNCKVSFLNNASKKLNENTDDMISFALTKTLEMIGEKRKRDYEVIINSNIPVKGMGSSAALAVCIAASVIKLNELKSDKKMINKIAYEIEKKQHGRPSGIDNAICTYGGLLWYRKEVDNFKSFQKVKVVSNLPEIYLLDSGRPTETTGEMVSMVNGFYKNKTSILNKTLYEFESTSKSILKNIINGIDNNFILYIRENERLLEKIGVVSESAKRTIRTIEKIGGVAKISGAGGKKNGSGLIIIYHPDKEKLLNFSKKNNLKLKKAKLNCSGVKTKLI